MKKLISIAICVLLLATLGLAGCSKETSALKVATNAEFEPFESRDKDTNEIIGFDVDLIEAIAKKMNSKIEFSDMEFEGVIAAVQSKSVNLAISGLTITPKRKLSVDFSEPYYIGAAQMVITRTDDAVFTGTTKAQVDEQLKGKNIGVCSGFTGESYVNGDDDLGFKKIEGATATVFDSIAFAIIALQQNAIDCIIMDDSVARKAVTSDENKDKLKLIDIALTIEEYAIAVPKGDAELKKQIDDALNALKQDGTLNTLLTKWELNG